MRALTDLGLKSLDIPSGHPGKKPPKPLDIKILLTHLSFLACGSLGWEFTPPPWAKSFTCVYCQASGNACGMNKGYPATVCPKMWDRKSPGGCQWFLFYPCCPPHPSHLWHLTHTYSRSRPAQS